MEAPELSRDRWGINADWIFCIDFGADVFYFIIFKLCLSKYSLIRSVGERLLPMFCIALVTIWYPDRAVIKRKISRHATWLPLSVSGGLGTPRRAQAGKRLVQTGSTHAYMCLRTIAADAFNRWYNDLVSAFVFPRCISLFWNIVLSSSGLTQFVDPPVALRAGILQISVARNEFWPTQIC